MKDFKDLLNVDEFKKHVVLQLENKDLELNKVFREKESKMLDTVMKNIERISEDLDIHSNHQIYITELSRN